MTFYVGQKVVCVDASGAPGSTWWGDIPVEGAIYTVAGQVYVETRNSTGLLLVEIRNGALERGAYNPIRFRPLVERKTDISFAHEILRKAEKRQRRSVHA